MMGRTAKTVLRNSRQKVRLPRKVCPFCFEGDHILGQRHNPNLIVEICQLHHAQLTDTRLAAGADMEQQRLSIKSVEMALRSLAATGHANASAIKKLSDGLEFCAEKLRVYEASRRARVKSRNRSGKKRMEEVDLEE
jgi:hypothetical protein